MAFAIPLLQAIGGAAAGGAGAGGLAGLFGGGAPAAASAAPVAANALGPSANLGQTALSPLTRTASQQAFSPFQDITGQSLAAGPKANLASMNGPSALDQIKARFKEEAEKSKNSPSSPMAPVSVPGVRNGPQRQLQRSAPSNIQATTFGGQQSPVSLSPFQPGQGIDQFLERLNRGLSNQTSPFGA